MTLLDGIATGTFRGPSVPVLETKRLALRAPHMQDAVAVATLINDRRIAENTARIPHPYTLADAEGFIARANQDDREAAFVITLGDDTVIGGCGVGTLLSSEPEIGYWIGIPYWGKGYATEAARALVDHAFGGLGYEKIEAGARVSNPASRRVLEKCGFQWTGVVLTRIRAIASAAPVDRFRLDRGLWASLRSWGAVKVASPTAHEGGVAATAVCQP
jgi:RimJ/RimL family protein N-acetyltransferase